MSFSWNVTAPEFATLQLQEQCSWRDLVWSQATFISMLVSFIQEAGTPLHVTPKSACAKQAEMHTVTGNSCSTKVSVLALHSRDTGSIGESTTRQTGNVMHAWELPKKTARALAARQHNFVHKTPGHALDDTDSEAPETCLQGPQSEFATFKPCSSSTSDSVVAKLANKKGANSLYDDLSNAVDYINSDVGAQLKDKTNATTDEARQRAGELRTKMRSELKRCPDRDSRSEQILKARASIERQVQDRRMSASLTEIGPDVALHLLDELERELASDSKMDFMMIRHWTRSQLILDFPCKALVDVCGPTRSPSSDLDRSELPYNSIVAREFF